MDKKPVYFTDFRTRPGLSMLDKLERLARKAGMEKIDFKDKFTAVKIHFGEPGNLAFIRPNYAAVIVRMIKELGGRPYLADCSTLYTGRRTNALDHLQAAYENGFSPLTVGCNIIIADGLRGYDYEEITINCKHCKTAKIASGIAQADIIVSMNHFKGHEMTGFGGAIKNLGMGSGSRAGKLEMHSGSKPVIKKVNCTSCGICIKSCSQAAIWFDENKKAEIDYEKCIGCGQCAFACRFDAAQAVWDQSADICNEMIAEYALAVVKGKSNFHINFVMDVSPDCDCFSSNDAPIVPNIGIAASFDPVALDRACAGLVNSAPAMRNSRLDKCGYAGGADKFTCVHPNTDWRVGLEHAEKIGLGSNSYELITF
jgi:uncharacterized Fe-S center protein